MVCCNLALVLAVGIAYATASPTGELWPSVIKGLDKYDDEIKVDRQDGTDNERTGTQMVTKGGKNDTIDSGKYTPRPKFRIQEFNKCSCPLRSVILSFC